MSEKDKRDPKEFFGKSYPIVYSIAWLASLNMRHPFQALLLEVVLFTLFILK